MAARFSWNSGVRGSRLDRRGEARRGGCIAVPIQFPFKKVVDVVWSEVFVDSWIT
jgi:hypothetical protein